jgi:hypothetical protein
MRMTLLSVLMSIATLISNRGVAQSFQQQTATDRSLLRHTLRIPRSKTQSAKEVPASARQEVQERALSAHESEVTVTRVWTNKFGSTQRLTSKYVHLSPGLNVRDSASGQWRAANSKVHGTPDGAVAEGGWFTAKFVNAVAKSAFDVQGHNGERLRGHVIGLRYEDLSTGKTVMLATTKESVPKVTADGRIVYADALDGLVAGQVVYHVLSGQVEQDVVVFSELPDPASFGLNAETTFVQALTEFVEAPEPTVHRHQLSLRKGQEGSAEITFDDHDLWFGSVNMALGRAFSEGSNIPSRLTPPPSVFVQKQWKTDKGAALLTESVLYSAWRELELQAGVKASPAAAVTETGENSPAVVLDWIAVASQPSYTFQSGETYRVTGHIVISSSASFEAGTVIKYDRDALLRIQGLVTCPASGTAILTAVDDHTVGQPIGNQQGPTGTYAQRALYVYPYGLMGNPENLQIRYAYEGIMAYSEGIDIQHITFINCTRGVALYYTEALAASLTFCDVPTQFYNYGSSSWNASGTITLVGKNDNDGDLLSNFEELVWWASNPLSANTWSATRKDGEYDLTAVTGQTGTRASIAVSSAAYNAGTDTSSLQFVVTGAFDNELHEIYVHIPAAQAWRNLFVNYAGTDGAGDHYTATAKGNQTGATFAALLGEDVDADALSDGYEVKLTGTIVGNPDSSSAVPGIPALADNGISDGDEDFDWDGWSNGEESVMGLNPLGAQDYSADSDTDGLPDWAENMIWLKQGIANPGLRDDSDGDGVDNYTEVAVNTDPSAVDEVYLDFSQMAGEQRAFTLAPMTVQHTSSTDSDSTKDFVYDNAGTLGTYMHVEVQRNQDAAGNSAPGQDTLLFGGAFLSPPSGMFIDLLADGNAPSDAYISKKQLLLTLTTLGADIWEEAKVSDAIDQMTINDLNKLVVIQQRSMLRTVVKFRKIQLSVNVSNPSTGDQTRLRKLISEIHTEAVLFRKTSAKIAQLQNNNWWNNAGRWVSTAGRVATVFSVLDAARDVWEAAGPYINDVRRRCDNNFDTAADLAVALGNFASNFADGFGEFGFWSVYWNQLTKFDGYDSTCQ